MKEQMLILVETITLLNGVWIVEEEWVMVETPAAA